MQGGPRESEDDKKARLRERKLSQMERDKATQETSADLTNDLRAVYGAPSLFSLMR